ncbi:fungal-specific transcription factor domain-containing protein [Xylariaceae sp. FL1651]|nr:fungal-specific transcription factor domain-containing protein [Xylariaceae sp. FL1651]
MSTTAAPPHQKSAKTLACVHCQYRKIKCDRQQPCSNCIKAKVACKPSTPAPPHKRRRPNQDLLERLARCEQLLKQYADGNVPAQGGAGPSITEPVSNGSQLDSSPAPPAAPAHAHADAKIRRPGEFAKVIEEDGNVRYLDNFIRISFHDELQAMRNIIDDEEIESEASPAGLSPDNNADLFLGIEESPVDLQELQPDLVNVFRLWQLFIDRVNPLTKVVHVPSLQQSVMDAATDINKVSLSHQALLFSVYTMAVVSLTGEESIQLLGMPRDDALNRFTRGTKLALVRLNYLKNHNMTTLQAVVLLMLSLQGRSDSHSNWIMSGTSVRIAQKMGYHRDGDHLNLSPFETEMRRRLWWHIVAQDSKQAMVSGLSHAFVPTNWDTKQPQNLNDADLFPNSLEPLVPRDGPSEMAFVLLLYKFQEFVLSTHVALEAAFIALRDGGKRDPQQPSHHALESYRSLIDDLDIKMAEFEQKYVDPAAGVIHEAASMVRPMFIGKMRSVMVPMREQPEWGTEIFDPVDSIFKSFIFGHAQTAAIYKRMAHHGFLWFVRMGFHFDSLLIFTYKLYKRPTGKLTDQAWLTLESLHDLHPDLFDMSQKKIANQAQFTLKAWAIREQALAQCGQRVEVPGFIHRLRECIASSRASPYSIGSSDSPTSASQPLMPHQTPPFQPMPQDIMDISQYLGANADAATLSLDMWGNLLTDETNFHPPSLPYGVFDFSKIDFSTTDYAG